MHSMALGYAKPAEQILSLSSCLIALLQLPLSFDELAIFKKAVFVLERMMTRSVCLMSEISCTGDKAVLTSKSIK